MNPAANINEQPSNINISAVSSPVNTRDGHVSDEDAKGLSQSLKLRILLKMDKFTYSPSILLSTVITRLIKGKVGQCTHCDHSELKEWVPVSPDVITRECINMHSEIIEKLLLVRDDQMASSLLSKQTRFPSF